MTYTNELIDRYKSTIKVDSDYAVAKALGIRPNRISNYRTGISHADDKTAVMLATVLHLDPMETIARINMDRASDKEDKAFWRRFAGTAAVVLCAIGLALPVVGKAHQIDVSPYSSGGESGSMHIM
jgi:anti-sigma-K factor RskA